MPEINPNRERSKLTLVLASIGAVAGVFELVAVATNAVPTISELLWATPLFFRSAVLLGAALVSIDHFITRKWL